MHLSYLFFAIGELELPSTPHFLWVTEFPLFARGDADKEFLTRGRNWSSTHHPFTAPMYEDLPAFYAGDYGRVRGQHYDLVLNGVEIGGGSVRIHDPAMQEYVFRDILQVSTIPIAFLFSCYRPCIHPGSVLRLSHSSSAPADLCSSELPLHLPNPLRPSFFFSSGCARFLQTLASDARLCCISWTSPSGYHSITWSTRSGVVPLPMAELRLVSSFTPVFYLRSPVPFTSVPPFLGVARHPTSLHPAMSAGVQKCAAAAVCPHSSLRSCVRRPRACLICYRG